MNLRDYRKRIKPEHWEEFQKLLPEQYRIKNDDFTILGNQMAKSPENQMSIWEAWDYNANRIAEKYNYDESDEEDSF